MSSALTLIIGSKNYSSWSLRPWLLLRQFDLPFAEIKLPLDSLEFEERIGGFSPSRRVPALQDGEVCVWDSLAIAEYVNERYLGGHGWPAQVAARAMARSISAEMHSGFSALRKELPMNCRKRVRNHAASPEAVADITRIRAIWREARSRYGADGEFLFARFSIADAMFAPVVLRFVSYGVELDTVERRYVESILGLPSLQEWLADAATEPLSPAHEKFTP
jgi:glutathione S-transferase